MLIREMFQKPIDRDIKGVIKVGQSDDENIKQELEEYVVTRELASHFTEFFANYKKGITGQTDKMGVWISGYFGSGKSHFLKILSYLLENKEVAGKRALNYFIDDNKIADAMVLADMKLCADLSPQADVVLFNIDSKSEQASKKSKDAIVSVFLKVFNEMLGFCGSIPHLANLERNLSDDGRYDEFKRLFHEKSGKLWEDERNDFDFIQDSIVETLVEMNYMSEAAARNWCEKAAGKYDISIETFAKLIAEYIKKKGNNHHVIFLVDEIGQYIGDDSNLMLNLQTVTEDLGTFCHGKAWVIVTSQQDIDSITKDMGLRALDFSKIQGRFDTRLSLSSANVDEVIKKRILDKNEAANQTLRVIYGQKETIIKNLIIFNDSVEKKLYSGETDFTQIYPLVPYQFNLMASVLTSIRKHSSSGKHLSDGERTMLAISKEATVKIMNNETGAIVPFSSFYDSLHRHLDHSHAGVIIRAMDNDVINPDKDTYCFAVEVLKTLFMVKYVNEVEANADNITSLMADNIATERIELKNRVDEALKILSGQMLIQKNGDVYVFLTDEEQEINREIDSQNVEMAEVTKKISDLIFEDIYSDKRYRYPEHNGRYTFAFNQFVDGHSHRANQGNDIGVRIITPNSDYKDEATFRMMSGQRNEVLVVLPDSRAFFDELHKSMKIDKFLRSPSSGGILTKYEQIKAAKGEEMRRRASDAKLFLQEAMKEADIYVNGDKSQIGVKEVTVRLNDALGRLVSTVYHKLPYIEAIFGHAEIRKLFEKSGQQSLSLDGARQANTHALSDVLVFISDNSARHIKTSMKTLHDRFQKAPYGFIGNDVEWLVAKLFTNGDIAFTVNDASVTLINKTSDEIINYIIKRDFNDRLLTERRERANESQKKIARELMKELFGTSGVSDDDDVIMQSFRKYCDDLMHTVKEFELLSQGRDYPGKLVMGNGKTLLRKVATAQSTTEFFKTITDEHDSFLDFAEDFKYVKEFFKSEQKKIFDDAIDKMRIYGDSKTFIVDEAIEKCVEEIKSILKMQSPYSSIPKLPGLVKKFTDSYMAVLDGMAKPIYDSIEEARSHVFNELNDKSYKDELSGRYVDLFKELKDKADTCNNVATFQNIKIEADALKIRLLNEMVKLDEQRMVCEDSPEHTFPDSDESDSSTHEQKQLQPRIKRVSIKSINTGGTWQIKSKADVDSYIDDLRKRLYNEVEDDTVLNIEF
ncbi:MAG: BREX system P-loop protein BrxC [Oscillospiraceae bacterium]|jgi:nucleoside-triphosphatase THEP1|nr:BREX system P-loop protein BrxC [Oscillospiraceae bacterium]